VDGANAFNGATKVDDAGNISVEFKLPSQIEKGDGTLALAITDGGVVETIAKTIPILVKSVDVQIYPEGGDLIAGLPCRVYIEARTPNQKPADLVGAIVDSKGNEITAIKTEHEGRGASSFTPKADEKYSLKVSQPAGIAKIFPLPEAKADGMTLSADSQIIERGENVKLTLAATSSGACTLSLSKHGTEVASVNAMLEAKRPHQVELTPPAWADGVLVATAKDANGTPVAERLIFRRPAKAVHVDVSADQSTYVPAGAVNLTITTTDDNGKAISAMVGITATDESVLQMVEKRERAPRLPAMFLLENDVKELADADIYLNPDDPKAALATDLLLGTQGWRRFATVDESKFIGMFDDLGRRALADLEPIQPATASGAVFFDGADRVDAMALRGAGVRRPAGRGGEFRFKEAELAPANVDKDLAAADIPADAKKANRARNEPVAALPPLQKAKQLRMGGGGFGVQAQAGVAREIVPAAQPSMPPVRVYSHDLRPGRQTGERTDFTETLYWCAGVKTDAKGTAKVSFKLNDAVTSFKVTADAFDENGALGNGETTIASVQPFYVEPKLPLEVTCGDIIRLPIAAVNGTSETLSNVKFTLTAKDGIEIAPIESFNLDPSARQRRVSEIKIGSLPMQSDFRIRASAGSYADDVTRQIVVKPLGFPIELAHGGMLDANSGVSHTIQIPDSVVAGSIVTKVSVFPTPLANMTEALQRLMQEPNGCFEQTSSTTYPLVMADQYFISHTGVDPAIIARSNELLAKGYDKLKGFECKNRGYEWFGQDPGHECLSAFGLLEFTDMSQVREVDSKMLANTRAWLLARRDGKGEYSHERRALHTWIADPGCANGYCTWALLECGEKNLDVEVKWMKDRCASDDNAYVTALGANVLHLAGDKDGAKALMDKLAKQQDKDGHVLGAKTTVVGSGGEALEIETTSLATLAWLREPSFAGNVEKAIHFLAESCKAGRFGSTQSTVLALRAINAYDKARAHPTAAGKVQVFVDGQPIGEAIAFDEKTHGALALPDIAEKLSAGKHEIALKMTDGSSLPYAMAITFNSLTPASSDQCKLRIETSLKDSKLVEGAPTEASVAVTNNTDETIPSPIAIVGIPGGLEVRHDQLKELVKADRIAAYEVRGREVILYWRDMQPKQSAKLPLSLIAAVPGTYTAPASRAYLYYTDEFKQWEAGMKVTITEK
jgi:hypothetical protein